MRIFRAGKNKQAMLYMIGALIMWIITVVGMIMMINHFAESGSRKSTGANPAELLGLGVLTVAFFVGFAFFGQSSGISNNDKLNVFAMSSQNQLFHVFYRVKDIKVGGDYVPATVIGKVVSLANSAKTISNISNRGDFLKSDKLSVYVEGVLDGTIENSQYVQINYMENPCIVNEKKGSIQIYYTTGEYKEVHSVSIFESHEGYQQIRDWIANQNCDKKIYAEKKDGDFLAEPKW